MEPFWFEDQEALDQAVDTLTRLGPESISLLAELVDQTQIKPAGDGEAIKGLRSAGFIYVGGDPALDDLVVLRASLEGEEALAAYQERMSCQPTQTSLD